MPPNENKSVAVPFRCEGFIDPYTGAVEVRTVDCERMPEMESVLRRRLQSLRRWSFSISKLRSLLLLILLASMLAALYGAVHNQLSFTVAPEYFTKIKFPQFGFAPETPVGNRWAAACVGVASTWWVGTIAASVLGLIGMIHSDRMMFRRTFRALLLMLVVAVAAGLLGLVVGEILASWINRSPSGRHLYVYDSPTRVFAVGMMHNASYLGGLIGLMIGIVDLRRVARLVQDKK